MALRIAVCFLLAGLCSGAAMRSSPVQKVIQLIDEMDAKVTRDLKTTQDEFEEYARFCDKEATSRGYAIKSSKKQIEELSATEADSDAKISVLEAKIEELTTQISAAEGEITDADALRAKQHADFVSTEAEMLETLETLTGATSALKKSLGFMQLAPGAPQREALDEALSMLGKVVDANFVSNAQREKVVAFLQAQEDAEDSLEIKAPEGDASAAIVGTLEDMVSKAEGTLDDTRRGEMDEAHSHALMKSSMENEVATMKDELSASTKAKQGSTETKAMATRDLGVEKKGLDEDNAYLGDLKRSCQERASEFEEEVKDGNAELKALRTAKALLAKKFSSFVQVHSRVAVRARDVSVEDARARALRRVAQLGKQYHSTALVAFAYRASSDPFVKVKSMIEDMIAKLLQEQAEQATQKAFCDKELEESMTSKGEKEESLAKTQARIDQASATTAKLTELVASLSKEVTDIDAAVADATAVRSAEKAEFVKVSKDLSESEEACAAAISVLREYYEGASLVQVSSRVSMKSKARAGTSGDGGGILAILELAEGDFAKLLAAARGTEELAAQEFTKMLQEYKLMKATKQMDAKGKESELKALQSSLSDYNEDKEGVSSELDAVLQYLDKLKPQCETKAPSYEEIKAKRDNEISGLKEALDILTGDGVPSFVQTSSHLRASHRA